jgi:hypothetical protein
MCNKRSPGSGCAAVAYGARMHAILGASEHCIALHASDLCVALAALDARVAHRGRQQAVHDPLTEFYVTPGDHPDIENVLDHGDLITRVELPLLPLGARSGYLKVRDRTSYEFALTSAAAALVIDDGTIASARLALGGVGTVPWRAREAEGVLAGAPATAEAFRAAAEAAIQNPFTVPGTAFKVELGKADDRENPGNRFRSESMTDVALQPDTSVEHKVIGRPMDRVDGPLKVRGAATYASDVTYPDMTHAALVQSTVAAGRIRRIDTSRAKVAPGVIAVITHENSPALGSPPAELFFPSARYPLEDDRILHHGQHVGIVVAESPAQALAAARLVTVEYDETSPVLGIENPDAAIVRNPFGFDQSRGDVAAALAAADVVYDQTFHIAAESNNPMGLFATVAVWDGDRLVVQDATQFPRLVRRVLAAHFGLPEEKVRVLVPYLGGGFGAGLRAWPHTILTAVAARMIGRPVKIVLSRPQMFNSTGHRPETRQRVRLGATRAGQLVAIDHEGTSTRGIAEYNPEFITFGTGAAYACPNVATRDAQVKLNIPSPNAMRGPGAVEGNFAIESALDELADQLQIDPIELRLLNYAEVHPQSGPTVVGQGTARLLPRWCRAVRLGQGVTRAWGRCARAISSLATAWPA